MKPTETPSLNDQFEKLPPHSIESEMCLLASMMMDAKIFHEVRGIVGREQFYQADHQVIFDALVRMDDAKKKIDAITVRSELERAKVLSEIGGVAYLGELLSQVPSAAHGVEYARIVREQWALRELLAVGNETLRRVYAGASQENWKEIAGTAMTRLAKLHSIGTGDNTERLDSILIGVYDKLREGGIETVPSGFIELDDATGGFGLGEMWLIGARPSMGKSTLSKQIGLRAAMAGVPAAILSLEEGKAKIGRNILSGEAMIENQRIRRPRFLQDEEWGKIDTAISRLGSVPLYVCDKARRLQDLKAEASLLVARHGVKLIIIDYLQRIQVPGKDKYERAGNASEGVSDMLKELGVAGVIPVQLNRGVESRDEKRPNMSDLRDSGQIEQDADGIIFLHREDYYHTGDANYQPDQKAELIFAKCRDGERGQTVVLKSNMKFQTFEDYDPFK